MDWAKIRLSPEELALVRDGEWVLTKNRIIQKVYALFGDMALDMAANIRLYSLPSEITETPPRISRGESYKGLPYVMLDYPRIFSRENIFAIRVFFWWGNYFSVTLHLKGGYKNRFEKTIRKNIGLLAANDFSICHSPEEWLHELDQENYLKIKGLGEERLNKILSEIPFLKFSAGVPFSQWENAPGLLGRLFNALLQSIQG